MEKYFFIVAFLLFCLLSSLGVCSNYGMELRVGNPDDTAKIERPCPTYDLNCIRVFFEKHAHCKKTFGPIPDPLFEATVNFYIPRVNISLIADQSVINNLNAGRIEEFYINRDTGNLVIAVQFKNMTQTTQNQYFTFHRRAKEPVVTVGSSIVTYTDLVTTAVIPNIDDLRLHDAECTTFSNGIVNQLTIDPRAAESTDPQVQVAFTDFLSNLPDNIQEIFLTESAFLIATFIQYNICDFGLLLD